MVLFDFPVGPRPRAVALIVLCVSLVLSGCASPPGPKSDPATTTSTVGSPGGDTGPPASHRPYARTLYLMDPVNHSMSATAPTAQDPFRRALTSIGQGWTHGDSAWFRSNLTVSAAPTEATLYLFLEVTDQTVMDGMTTVSGKNPRPACTWVVRWTFADVSKNQCYPFQLGIYDPGHRQVALPLAGDVVLTPDSLTQIKVEIMAAAATSFQARPTLFLLSGAIGAESSLEFGFEPEA